MGFYAILKQLISKNIPRSYYPLLYMCGCFNAILYHGAKPVYREIKDDDYNIDVSKIEELITLKQR